MKSEWVHVLNDEYNSPYEWLRVIIHIVNGIHRSSSQESAPQWLSFNNHHSLYSSLITCNHSYRTLRIRYECEWVRYEWLIEWLIHTRHMPLTRVNGSRHMCIWVWMSQIRVTHSYEASHPKRMVFIIRWNLNEYMYSMTSRVRYEWLIHTRHMPLTRVNGSRHMWISHGNELSYKWVAMWDIRWYSYHVCDFRYEWLVHTWHHHSYVTSMFSSFIWDIDVKTSMWMSTCNQWRDIMWMGHVTCESHMLRCPIWMMTSMSHMTDEYLVFLMPFTSMLSFIWDIVIIHMGHRNCSYGTSM